MGISKSNSCKFLLWKKIKTKVLILFLLSFFSSCVFRVDWSDLTKSSSTEKEEESINETGNLTKKEISKGSGNQTNTNSSGLNVSDGGSDSSSIAKSCSTIPSCYKNCNKEFDTSKTVFSVNTAITKARRDRCYDSCYTFYTGIGCRIDKVNSSQEDYYPNTNSGNDSTPSKN